MKARTIEATIPATTEPELGEWRCPNGHDSAIRPRLPELMFHACGHYHPTVITWNEFCLLSDSQWNTLGVPWTFEDTGPLVCLTSDTSKAAR